VPSFGVNIIFTLSWCYGDWAGLILNPKFLATWDVATQPNIGLLLLDFQLEVLIPLNYLFKLQKCIVVFQRLSINVQILVLKFIQLLCQVCWVAFAEMLFFLKYSMELFNQKAISFVDGVVYDWDFGDFFVRLLKLKGYRLRLRDKWQLYVVKCVSRCEGKTARH